MTIEEIRAELFRLKEDEFKAFQSKLMPTVSAENILGVRTPALRALAKMIYRSGEYEAFLRDLPHRYFDENNLHGFILSEMRDYEKVLPFIDEFLPFVDNWATCDQLRPKAFSKRLDALKGEIFRWIASGKEYTVRFGVEMAMTFFLGENFDRDLADEIAAIKSEEYYVKMIVAWYFATSLAKNRDETMPYFEEGRLEKWTHNKAIQKSVESYRISPEDKNYLRSLKK